MPLRETINKHPSIVAGIVIAVILAAILTIFWELNWFASRPKAATRFYFSDDDGKTWFADDAKKLPPFTDSKGKEAVRAWIFRCGNGQPFCGYLDKYAPDLKEVLQSGDPDREADEMPGHLVKEPDDTDWYDPKSEDLQEAATANEIMAPTCPEGSSGELMPVYPP